MNALTKSHALQVRRVRVMHIASKFRIRTKSWMNESQYVWHLVHTDHMNDTSPREAIGAPPMLVNMSLAGELAIDLGQGPPVK